MRRISVTLATIALATGCTHVHNSIDPHHVYRLYFLGGQSNMEGFGYQSELSGEDRSVAEGVMIFAGKNVEDGKYGGGIGRWARLTPGFGTGFDTNGRDNALSDRFGPEWSFGKAIAAAHPGERVALVKYSRGGTGLIDEVSGYGSWDPAYRKANGRNQYDNALTAIEGAMTTGDIDGDGIADRLVPAGIVWMQGEADAYDSVPAARDYANNLARLMGLLRGALGKADLPVVVGRIRDSGDTPATQVMKFSPQVRAAQHDFVAKDTCAALVTASDGFGFLPDGWHYRSQDYIVLGKAFAADMARLERKCR